MLLKKDTFGEIRETSDDGMVRIVRDASRASPWVRWLARRLLAREARALARLDGLPGVPCLIDAGRYVLRREFVAGQPLHIARPTGRAEFFREAARRLRRMHTAGVIHNDLAKEPNILMDGDGQPVFIDFQLASVVRRRNRLHRILAREDLRHLLKHKRTYCPSMLTRRERDILRKRSLPSRVFRATVKPVYMFVTRRILRWADREGAGDRSRIN